MLYRQSVEGCLSRQIGSNGLSDDRLDHWLTRLTPRFRTLSAAARDGGLAHFRVLSETGDLSAASTAYLRLAEGAETMIVLGTGGSSLGGQALAQLGGWSIPGDNGPDNARRPRLRFYDNLDARSFMQGLRILDIPKARFAVISKSGGTGETLAQTLTAFAFIERAGYASLIPQIFIGVTEPERDGVPNGLRSLFAERGIPMLPHDTEIGGRYSIFTAVGMIPAFARGLDFAAFRKGAQKVVTALAEAASPETFPPSVGAAVAIGLLKDRAVTNSVMMPYCDRLARFSAWYVQLWAESLGKQGAGSTPVAALGPVDQHSQLQLYMDGPRSHFLTFLRIGQTGLQDDDLSIPASLAAEAGAPYLASRTIGDLVRAQASAIPDALVSAGRPARTIDVERLNEESLGALAMHFMIETILAADLLGVDPFDQPAVELGKQLTRQYLGS